MRELEARIAQLEREKAAAESHAAEEARVSVEKQAAAGGQPADPAAIARAQEEARRRAREEQERKQQEELLRLADEKRAEELRLRGRRRTPAPTPAATPCRHRFPRRRPRRPRSPRLPRRARAHRRHRCRDGPVRGGRAGRRLSP